MSETSKKIIENVPSLLVKMFRLDNVLSQPPPPFFYILIITTFSLRCFDSDLYLLGYKDISR